MNNKYYALLAFSASFSLSSIITEAASNEEVINEIMLYVYEMCYEESAKIMLEGTELEEMGVTVDDLVLMMKNLNVEALQQAAEEAATAVLHLETLEQRMQFYDIARKGCVQYQTR